MRVFVIYLLLASLVQAQHYVVLNWNDDVNAGSPTYSVYRASPDCSATFVRVQSGIPKVPDPIAYTDSAVVAGGSYCYYTTAVDPTVTPPSESMPSNTSLAIIPSDGNSTTIGETNILPNDDNGNGDLLVAQNATLAQPATIQSLSFYVTVAGGNLLLGLYDASGPAGGPGLKVAETASFTPVVGWNTTNVVVPVSLSAGTYWLAYFPSSNALSFKKADQAGTSGMYYSLAFSALPATFSTTPSITSSHWSFYATLITGTGAAPGGQLVLSIVSVQ